MGLTIVDFLKELGYKVERNYRIGNLKMLSATKKINDIEIMLRIEVVYNEIKIIRIDALKGYKTDLVYNKLLKSYCRSLEDLNPTINKLINIIKKEDKI